MGTIARSGFGLSTAHDARDVHALRESLAQRFKPIVDGARDLMEPRFFELVKIVSEELEEARSHPSRYTPANKLAAPPAPAHLASRAAPLFVGCPLCADPQAPRARPDDPVELLSPFHRGARRPVQLGGAARNQAGADVFAISADLPMAPAAALPRALQTSRREEEGGAGLRRLWTNWIPGPGMRFVETMGPEVASDQRRAC